MRFPFFKKKSSIKSEAPTLLVDIHSHLIPGIDDGSQSMQESLALLRALEALGYQKVITTPHIMADAYKNTKQSILEGLKILQIEAQKASISLHIEAAAEYYLDEGLLPLIQKKEILLIDETYLLFETSYTHRPHQLEETIFEILAAGYTPLLAHPERYRYITDTADFHTLKALGTSIQINLNSFNGHYGKHAQKHAHYLSQKGLIDFLGSDTHHIKHLQHLKPFLGSKAYQEIYLHNTIGNNTFL